MPEQVTLESHPQFPGVFVQKGLPLRGAVDWQAKYLNHLLNRRIVRIDLVDHDNGVVPVLVFDDGSYADVMCDPEGSGPGALHITDKEGNAL